MADEVEVIDQASEPAPAEPVQATGGEGQEGSQAQPSVSLEQLQRQLTANRGAIKIGLSGFPLISSF